MRAANRPFGLLLDPALYFGAFLFLVLTSLHHQLPFPGLYNIEYVLLSVGFFALIPRLRASAFPWVEDTETRKHGDAEPTRPWRLTIGLCLVGFLIIVSPLLSHAINAHDAEILKDSNWRALAKVYVAAGGLMLAFVGRRRALIDVSLVSLAVFAVVFLIHRFVLGEVDEATQRPILSTTHGDPNFIASLLVAGIPLAAYQWLVAFRDQRPWRAALYVTAAALSLSVIVLTESRMALIALGAAGAFALWRVRWPVARTRIVAYSAAIVVVAGLVGGSQVIERFRNLADDSNQDRVRSIENGWVMFGQKPVFGHGMHSAWRSFYKNSGYGVLEDESRGIDVHNTPVQILAELGLFGLAAHVVLLFFVVTCLRRAAARDADRSALALASLLSLGVNMLSLPMGHQYLFHQWVILLLLIQADAGGATNGRPNQAS